MEKLNEFVERVAGKAGFEREVYTEGTGEPLVIPLLADRRHEFALSVWLHHHLKGERYLIIAGPPGRGALFPGADEYWGMSWGVATDVALNAIGWDGNCPKSDFVEKQLNKYVETADDLDLLYHFGFKTKFFDDHKFVTNNMPGVPALKTDYKDRLSDKNVILVPNRSVIVSRRGVPVRLTVNRQVYVALVERLKAEGYNPVVLQGGGTYDISPSVSDCAVFSGLKAGDELAIVRTGVLVDLFAGDNRLALLARAPYVCVAERQTYEAFKDFEADDLVGSQVPHSYIFSFSTMIEANEYVGIIDGVLAKLKTLPVGPLPSTAPISVAAPYVLVRARKAKKFGNRLFRLPKID